ncbi:MAG: DUF697 domain-containing protein [Planctomycetota bacterium]|jgi:hypothetical protein|nr:DUF697 domain-containing protein [Planctomycetota bacterium]
MPSALAPSPNTPDTAPDYLDSPGRTRPGGRPESDPPEPGGHPETPAALPEFPIYSPGPEFGFRVGECRPNLPDVEPRYVTSDQAVLLPPSNPAPDPASTARAGAGRNRLAFAVALGLAGLFCLFILGQGANLLALARTLPAWAGWLLFASLGACALPVLWLGLGAIRSWAKLAPPPTVSLSALKEQSRGAGDAGDWANSPQAARIGLEKRLAAYPLDPAGAARLEKAGCPAELVRELARERDYLLGLNCDSLSWLEDFQARFQNRLDRAAAARIRAWALKAAFGAMASPLSLLDAILALGAALKMLGDLATLYNARCNGPALPVLLGRVVFSAFLAGGAGEAAERLGDALKEDLSGWLGLGMAGKLAPKLAEGAVDFLFISRLGRTAMKMLRPLDP